MKTKYVEGVKHGKFPQVFTGSNHLSRKDSPGVPLQGGQVSPPHTRLWSISTGTLDPFVSFSPAQDRWHAAESTYIFVTLRRNLWAVLSLYISQSIGWFSWMSLSLALGNLLFITWCIIGCGRPKWVGIRWWEYLPMHRVIGSGNFP